MEPRLTLQRGVFNQCDCPAVSMCVCVGLTPEAGLLTAAALAMMVAMVVVMLMMLVMRWSHAFWRNPLPPPAPAPPPPVY